MKSAEPEERVLQLSIRRNKSMLVDEVEGCSEQT